MSKLNELDEAAQVAATQATSPSSTASSTRCGARPADGEPLSDDHLHRSDVVIPPSDLTLEETKRLFSDEGLIPDIPS